MGTGVSVGIGVGTLIAVGAGVSVLVGGKVAGCGTGDGVGEALGETEVGGIVVASGAGVWTTTSSDSISGWSGVATGTQVGGGAVASGLTTTSTDFGVVLTAGVMVSSVTTGTSSVSAQLTIDMRAAEATKNFATSPLYLCLCER